MSEPEVLGGPLKPLDREDSAIYAWKGPDHKTLRTRQRVAQIEAWIESQHAIVDEEEIIRYAMSHFGLTRENAKHYLNKVVEDFERLGIPVVKS